MTIRTKIYVRPTGDDFVGDGTSTKPYRTVQRALKVIPIIDSGDLRYVIDNTGCVDTNPIVFPPFLSGQFGHYDVGSDFAPYNFEGYVTLQALPKQLAALNGSTTTITYDSLSGLAKVRDSSKAWTVDDFKGKWVVGSGMFDLAAIAGNTADTLDTAASASFPPFTPPIHIVDCGAELKGAVALSGVRAPISFNGQRIIQSGPYANGLRVTTCQEFVAALCDLKNPWIGGNDWSFIHAYIHGEGGGNITDVVFDNNWGQMRGYIADCSPDTSDGFATIQGILENCSMPFGFSSSGQFVNCECRTTPFVFGAGAITAIYLKVNDVPGDAVIANGPGALELWNVGTGPSVGGIGLRASNGAQVHVHGNVSPVGASGDLKVGQNPVRSWASFRSGLIKNEVDQTPGTGDGSRVWE